EHFGGVVLPSVNNRAFLVWCMADVGAFAEGMVLGEEALRIAEAVGRPNEHLAIYCRLGYLHLHRGDFHNAITLFERAMRLSQEANIPLYFGMAAAYLAPAYARCGRAADALALVEQVVGQTGFANLRLALAGETYLLVGRLEDASLLALRTLERIR